MSRIQSAATAREWAYRKEHGRREIAKDRWCVTSLLRSGAITSDQHGAAVRLSTLMERAAGQTGGATGEFVDGGGSDPHARMFDAALCAREAECALASVRTRLAGPHASARISALDAALSFPHETIAGASRSAGIGYGRQRDFIALLKPGLDLLVVYFDAVDAQALRERKRGVV